MRVVTGREVMKIDTTKKLAIKVSLPNRQNYTFADSNYFNFPGLLDGTTDHYNVGGVTATNPEITEVASGKSYSPAMLYSKDGLKVFLVSHIECLESDLSEPYRVSRNNGFRQYTVENSITDGVVSALFNKDGTKIFLSSGPYITTLKLPNPYSLVGVAREELRLNFSNIGVEGAVEASFFSEDGTKVFCLSSLNGFAVLYGFALKAPYDLLGPTLIRKVTTTIAFNTNDYAPIYNTNLLCISNQTTNIYHTFYFNEELFETAKEEEIFIPIGISPVLNDNTGAFSDKDRNSLTTVNYSNGDITLVTYKVRDNINTEPPICVVELAKEIDGNFVPLFTGTSSIQALDGTTLVNAIGIIPGIASFSYPGYYNFVLPGPDYKFVRFKLYRKDGLAFVQENMLAQNTLSASVYFDVEVIGSDSKMVGLSSIDREV